jgi:hypothetical protein
MKLVAGLAFAIAAALLAGCIEGSYMHLGTSGRLAPDDEIAYTQSDSACDTAGARERGDPASPCVVAPRKEDR